MVEPLNDICLADTEMNAHSPPSDSDHYPHGRWTDPYSIHLLDASSATFRMSSKVLSHNLSSALILLQG